MDLIEGKPRGTPTRSFKNKSCCCTLKVVIQQNGEKLKVPACFCKAQHFLSNKSYFPKFAHWKYGCLCSHFPVGLAFAGSGNCRSGNRCVGVWAESHLWQTILQSRPLQQLSHTASSLPAWRLCYRQFLHFKPNHFASLWFFSSPVSSNAHSSLWAFSALACHLCCTTASLEPFSLNTLVRQPSSSAPGQSAPLKANPHSWSCGFSSLFTPKLTSKACNCQL